MPRGVYERSKEYIELHRKLMLGNTFSKGNVLSLDTKNKMSEAHTGKVASFEHRQSISEALKGEKNPNWKGGITSITRNIRGSFLYKLWRKTVFERDNRMCVWCSSKEEIEADHIKPFALFPELRLDINNGRTLCKPCHITTGTYGV